MGRILKKCFSTIVLTLIISALLVQSALAITDLGELQYWYSNESAIGYWNSKTVKVAITTSSNSQMPSGTIVDLTNSAFNAWVPSESLTGVQGTPSDYNWLSYGISRSEATNLGMPANADAATSFIRTLTATATHSGSRKNVYSISKALTYFIWDSQTSSYSQTKWNAIGAHEFGHASGYFGHDIDSSWSNYSLMNPYTNVYFDSWGVTSPQTRDVNHMSGV